MRIVAKIPYVLAVFLYAIAAIIHEPEGASAQSQEPKLYDHYLALRGMQESLARRSLEEQMKLQPRIRVAEHRACEQIRKDRLEGVQREAYRRQGGEEFLVFSLQFEQYCQTLR